LNYLIDTHAHLYANQFSGDRDAMIKRAIGQNIQQFVLPNIDLASIPGMLELEKEYPNRCFATMGLHPCSVEDNYIEVLNQMEKWLRERPFVAVGEIGLDYHWSKTHVKEQKDAFRIQCRWAMELDLPIIIHARDSMDDLIDLVTELKTDERLRGIFHCFGGSIEQANRIMELGFWMGIGGVITYKKSGLDQVVKDIPLEYLVLETDAPYLAPVPFRGKRNETAYTHYIADKLADAKGISLEEVAKATSQNAANIFKLPVYS
jgi:TatD DNase family protein